MYVLIQGMLFSTPECLKSPVDLVRLWLHEASRVYGDKLIEPKDITAFAKMKLDIAKSSFEVSIYHHHFSSSETDTPFLSGHG